MGRMLIARGMALAVDETDHFVVKVCKGFSADVLGTKIKIEYHFDHPVFLKEISDTQCPNKDYFLSHGLDLFVPMISSTKMIGALCLGSKMTKQDFTKRELEFLDSLSNIAAASIENALMFDKLEKVNRRLDKKVQELKTLFEIGKELNSTLELSRIVNILQFTIMGEMAVNKLLLFIKQNGTFQLVANRGINDSSQIFSLLTEARMLNFLEQQQSSILIEEHTEHNELTILHKAGLNVLVPMRVQEDSAGILLLGPKMSRTPYAPDELDFLSTLGNRVMISIENARLFEETLEKQRLEEEIAIARDIQQRLLPRSFPQIKTLDIYGFNIPSQQVGGDYFDCFELDGDRVALAIGDVSGKGVGASLLMSNLHAGLNTLIDSNIEMHAILAKLNNLIYENTNYDKFITFFYGEYNIKTADFTFVNAGHNPPYLFHQDGSFELLEDGGLLLGMMPNMVYETGTVTIKPGDFIVTFTDGVTEAKDKTGDMYEEDRLEEFIGGCMAKDLSVKEFADVLISELNRFSKGVPQADDITFLGMKLNQD
jgi:sigma-B regulation protein RsbU (phosphoserine phosphatase)